MGYDKLRLRKIDLGKFDKGYFPNKDFDDVPLGGTRDCNNVIWYRSALRKMFGMDLVNAAAAATTLGHGIHYFHTKSNAKLSAVFGAGFYEDVSGTWTARTGAVTITDADANLAQGVSFQQGATELQLWCNGVDAPWAWTGTGNAAVLGGTPPTFSTMEVYRQNAFGALNESVRFSDTGDPTSWPAYYEFFFPFSITKLITNGTKLACCMADRIGSVQGFDALDFTQQHSEVLGVGCAGRNAATTAFYGANHTPVICSIASDGIWMIDEQFGTRKLFGDYYFEDLTQASLSKAVCAYSSVDRLFYAAVPSNETNNNTLIVIDMVSGAVWPCTSIHANFVRGMASAKTSSGEEFVYFIDNAGYAFLFNKDTKNYHTGTATQAISARYKTNRFDLTDVHSLAEAVLLADSVGDWSLTMYINFGLESGDGSSGTINMVSSGDLLGSSFVLGASVLGGTDYVFEILSGVGGFGRFFDVTFTQSTLSQDFRIRKAELLMRRRRKGGNDK